MPSQGCPLFLGESPRLAVSFLEYQLASFPKVNAYSELETAGQNLRTVRNHLKLLGKALNRLCSQSVNTGLPTPRSPLISTLSNLHLRSGKRRKRSGQHSGW